jgi:hypothetical protein
MRDQKTSLQKNVLSALQLFVALLPNIIVPNILRVSERNMKQVPVRVKNGVDKDQ